MGLNGFFIIAQAPGPLYALSSIQRMSTESGEDYVYPASWMGLRADGEWQQLQISQGHSLELRDLVAETGAAAMSIQVLESAFGCIEARTLAGDEWWGYLNPETAVAAYEMPKPPSLDEVAKNAVAWAAETGRTATVGDVEVALRERVGPFGEGIDELTHMLGFRFGRQLPIHEWYH